jgi:hypothetical protein
MRDKFPAQTAFSCTFEDLPKTPVAPDLSVFQGKITTLMSGDPNGIIPAGAGLYENAFGGRIALSRR